MDGNSQASSSSSNPNDPKEDIILICEPSKVTNLFTKEHVIVWYDPNLDSSDYIPYIEQLKAISDLKTFQNWEEACVCINQLESACQIITSISNGEPFCQAISHIENVSNICVFSTQEDPKPEWIKDYPKIACVEKDFSTLLKNIKENMIKQKHNSFLRSSFPAFCPVFDDVDKSIVNHFHLYLKGFVNFQNRNQAKKDFLRLARDAYHDEEHIQEFENTYNDYNQKAILNWYTKESFFYRVTNNCLRIASSDSVQYCRLILKDLETAIKEYFQQKSKFFHGLLYRGAYLSHQEWVEMEGNIGKEIQIFGFLSTSKGKDTALKFAQSDVARKVLITIVVPDMPTKDEQGFAELSEFTDLIGEEEEVLFNVRSKFTIIEASVEEIDGQQCRHLVLVYGTQEMRKHVSIEEARVEVSVPKKDEISCSVCHSKTDMSTKQELFFVGLHDKDYYSCTKCVSNPQVIKKSPFLCMSSANPDFIADKMNVKLEGFIMKYNQDLDIPFYGSKCVCCEQKEPIYQQFRCLTCQEHPRTWCKKCGDKIHECIEKKHNVIYECQPFTFWSEKMSVKEAEYFLHQEETSNQLKIFEQGETYYLAHDYVKAKQFYEEFLKQGGYDNPYQISCALFRLGAICYQLGLHQEAIVWHMKDLKLTDAIYGEDNPLLARILNGIGNNFDMLGEYRQACHFHLEALALRIRTLGEKHSETAQSFCNLGFAYNNLKEYQQAAKCLSKAIEIDTELYGPTCLSLAKSYNFLGIVFDNLGLIEGSIDCYLKSIEINKTVYGEINQDIAMTYNNLAIIMVRLGDFDKSIEFQMRSLSIKMTLFGGKHPRIADSLTNLASVYLNTKEYDKAIEMFHKSLEIYQEFFGEKHVRTIKMYQNLGIAYTLAGDEEKAKEYKAKAGTTEEK